MAKTSETKPSINVPPAESGGSVGPNNPSIPPMIAPSSSGNEGPDFKTIGIVIAIFVLLLLAKVIFFPTDIP